MRYWMMAAVFLTSATAWAGPTTAPADQAALEASFAKTMSNATLVGSSVIDDKPAGKDSYRLGPVTKGEGDLWIFDAVIGEYGMQIPLSLPVKWAGDTAVITVDNLGIPGHGTFTARVTIHGDRYAGVWSGGPAHGGYIWGKIEHPAATQPAQ